MAVVDVLARVKADTSGFTSGITDAQRALNKFSTSAVTKGTIIGNVLFQAANKAATGFGRLLVGAFRDSMSAATEAQAVQVRLARLLTNTNGATQEQIALLHQQAKALEATTVVTAENVTMVQSQLATFDLHASSIAQLTPAILDYVVAERGASATTDTFRSYTNGLAQALNGQFGALSRVGFVLSDYDKQMIKTGTENERAAAIVRILNTTYKDFAATAMTPAVRLSKAIQQLKGDFGNALLPVVQRLQTAMADRLIPVFESLQARFSDSSQIQNFINFVKELGQNVLDFARGIGILLEPLANLFMSVLEPAIKLVGAAFIGLIEALGAIGRFIERNQRALKLLVGVLFAVTAATIAYRLQVLLLNKTNGLFLKIMALKTVATAKATLAMKKLNLMMKMNPIGFLVGALAAAAAGFAYLWKNSEHFRKVMVSTAQAALRSLADIVRALGTVGEAIVGTLTKPMRDFLGVLANIPKVGGAFKKVKEFADKMVDGIGNTAVKAGAKLDELADNLDNFGKKKIKAPKAEKPKGPLMPDLSLFGSAGGDPRVDEKEQKRLAKLAEQLAKAKKVVQEKVQDYNDYLQRDFANSMMKGADAAEDAVMRLLEKTQSIFDAQAKVLSGPALANLEKTWDKVNTKVRKMMERYGSVAGEIAEIEDQIQEAYKQLEDAIKERQSAVSTFQQIIAQPFGEPSELDRAFGATTATVDSIIGMYDKLREAITRRYTGIDPSGRDTLLNFLEEQTGQLVALARRREKAVEMLTELEQELASVVAERAEFARSIRSSFSDFATALADLSQAEASSTIRVVKTATGLVVTQFKQSTSGIDKITKQLRDRLNQMMNFNANIQRLLARGLDPEYIRQLIQAGPEAASETAQVLASAGDTQIAEINNLYKQINSEATSFGNAMAGVFYNNAVSMNRAFVNGARTELKAIDDQMIAIRQSVEEKLLPLADFGSDLGMDLAQGIYDSLLAQKDKLVTLAQNIAAAISEALASALSKIGVSGVETLPKPATSGSTQDLRARTEELKKRTAELRARLEGKKATTPPTVTSGGTTGGTTGGASGMIPVGSSGAMGGVNATVNINTSTVAETVTPATIAQALEYTLLTRRAV